MLAEHLAGVSCLLFFISPLPLHELDARWRAPAHSHHLNHYDHNTAEFDEEHAHSMTSMASQSQTGAHVNSGSGRSNEGGDSDADDDDDVPMLNL